MSYLLRFVWLNSCVKKNILPHILVLFKVPVVLRWLIWCTLFKIEDDLDLCHNVIVARKVSALQNISARNPAIIARRKIILLRIVMYALEINLFLLFILLFSSFLCLHFPHNLLFWVLLPIFFFWIRGNPTPRKAHFVGSGERGKLWLSQTLTRGALPDSNSRPAVQISSHLSSR
jgi:hypothetical protein